MKSTRAFSSDTGANSLAIISNAVRLVGRVKPPIITLSPVSTEPRVLILASLE